MTGPFVSYQLPYPATSGEYLVGLFTTPSTQRVESPVNPGRFICHLVAKFGWPKTREK